MDSEVEDPFGRLGAGFRENWCEGAKSLTDKKNNSPLRSSSKSPAGSDKARIDELLVARGLADDLSHARALVMAGKVLVGEQRHDKPGHKVEISCALRVKGESRFVSRGGDKLHAALQDLGMLEALKGQVVLDVGASTGGFTHCCLDLGAKAVIALDVGTGQLAWELRQDPRVTSLERTDIRAFDRTAHPRIDWVVADISFNSLARLAPALRDAAPLAHTRFLVLVKPQFELPRAAVPPGGVVTDPAARDAALEEVRRAFAAAGLGAGRAVPSRLAGRAGNQEIFFFAEG